MSPIITLHRHTDGVITFARKTADGTFHNIGGIRPAQLETIFPEFREELERDSYFSINAFWHRDQRSLWLPAIRKKENVRYLTCVFTDIDCYNVQIDWAEAFVKILGLQDGHCLPPASIIERSGRGLWIYWLLADEENAGIPQRAWAEKLKMWAQIQREIGVRLADFGADIAASDLARITRVPGSVNTRATATMFRRVKFWIQLGTDSKPYLYTLRNLAHFFQIAEESAPPIERAYREAREPKGNRRLGWGALHARRLREFDLLHAVRGGFREGHRNRAALLYAWLLRGNGEGKPAALKLVEDLGAHCTPPLSGMECRGAVLSGFSRNFRRLSDETIAEWVEVTPEEALLLEGLPPAMKFLGKRSLPEPAAERVNQERRREMIGKTIGNHRGGPISSRQMATILQGRGVTISYRTIQDDYRALGVYRWSPANEQLTLQEDTSENAILTPTISQVGSGGGKEAGKMPHIERRGGDGVFSDSSPQAPGDSARCTPYVGVVEETTVRCRTCAGSGRLRDGGYCSCSMGKDLARVDRRLAREREAAEMTAPDTEVLP